MHAPRPLSAPALAALLVTALLAAGAAVAQPTYSIDFQGPSRGAPDGLFGAPIIEGDILTPLPPGTPPPAPGILIFAAAPGLSLIVPPMINFCELDALSYGNEPLLRGGGNWKHVWQFSVDEHAAGRPGVTGPSVRSEGAVGMAEASADLFLTNTVPGPVASLVGVNQAVFDGDGLPPWGGPGLNLVEPNPPTPGLPFDPGDNVDAFDGDQPAVHPVFFSLDGPWIDPLEAPPANTATAPLHGFFCGDVLLSPGPNNPPVVYANVWLLGLDSDGLMHDTDDVDALVVGDSGDLVYQPVTGPYSWLLSGTDMLLYSVRRGSAVVGMPDVLLGLPIEEGDVLVPVFDPVDGVPMFDGREGDWDPGIFVAAEALGLATARTGNGLAWGVINPAYGIDIWGDELDALDVTQGDARIFVDGFQSGNTSAWSASVP